jgi:hypothetical protein
MAGICSILCWKLEQILITDGKSINLEPILKNLELSHINNSAVHVK